MFYDILDKKRIEILPLLKNFKQEFYLAGGTSLALQIGHRDSVDFDFFKHDDIDIPELFGRIKNIFHDYPPANKFLMFSIRHQYYTPPLFMRNIALFQSQTMHRLIVNTDYLVCNSGVGLCCIEAQ